MKIYSVQYMRGLAALIVLVAHSLQHPITVENTDYLRLGSLGVLMFFVISGFIMVFISGEGRFAPGGFIERRLIRIVPLYWLATFAVALVALLAPNALKTTVYSTRSLILSLFFIPHYGSRGELAPILKLGWTLNYEMFFYAFFAAFAFLKAGARVAALTGLFLVFSIAGELHDFANPLLQFYSRYILLAFCVGTWIGYLTLKGWSAKGKPMLLAVLAVSAVALIGGGGFGLQHGSRGGEAVTACMTLGSAALLLLGLGLEQGLPHLKLPALLGDASYSIYLIHMYFVAGAVAVMRHLFHAIPMLLLVPTTLLIAGTGGVIVHLLVEKPLLRLLQRPRKRPAPAAHPAIPTPVDGMPPSLIPDTPSAA